MSMTIDPTTPLEPGVMNGTVAYAPPPVRSSPRNREAWLDLADDGFYQGWRVLVRMRFSVATGREMASGDVPRITEALKSMVLAQEGFTDAETGEPLPPARAPEGQPNACVLGPRRGRRDPTHHPGGGRRTGKIPRFGQAEQQQLAVWLRAPNKAGLKLPWVYIRRIIAKSWGLAPVVVDQIKETHPNEIQIELDILRIEAECQPARTTR
jgi:hypothetical protein